MMQVPIRHTTETDLMLELLRRVDHLSRRDEDLAESRHERTLLLRTSVLHSLAEASRRQPSVIDRKEWDLVVDRLLLLDTIDRADRSFGRFAREVIEPAKWASAFDGPSSLALDTEDAPGEKLHASMIDIELAAEEYLDEAFGEPFRETMRKLLVLPAPDLFAARFKAELIAREDSCDDWAECDPMEAVQRDLDRLLVENEAARALHVESTA